MTWELAQWSDDYIDYDHYFDVGDDDVYVYLRATWDTELDRGYVALFATTDGGAKELLQFDFPKQLTAAEYSALTGHQFEEFV